MDTKEMIEKLNALIQVDVDAVHAYEQAIERIDVMGIGEQLEQFKHDHERHIDELSQVVRSHGGEPTEPSRDVKGFFLESFTAIRSVTGTEGALKAMRSNEKITNKSYEDALSADLPQEVLEIVRRNREDERRHLEYIEQCLEQKVWEQAGTETRPGA